MGRNIVAAGLSVLVVWLAGGCASSAVSDKVADALTSKQMETVYSFLSPEGRVNASERKYAETHSNLNETVPYDKIRHTR